MKLSATFFLFPFLFSMAVFSQQNDSTYQQYLLNNKNVPKRVYYNSNEKNILKTSIFSIMDGNLPIIWEHRFNDYLALKGGPGLLLPYTQTDLFTSDDLYDFYNLLGVNTNFKQRKIGASFQLESKLYMDICSSYFISAFYRYRGYSSLNINEIGIAYGVDLDSDYFANELSFAVSYLNQVPISENSEVRFSGVKSSNLSSYGLAMVNTIQISFRLHLGYIIQTPLRKKKTP